MPLKSIFTYEGLPISSGGGHTLKTRSPSVALRQVEHFLNTCTAPEQPMRCSIELVSGAGIPSSFSDALLQELTHKHGACNERGLGSNTGHRWVVPRKEAQQVATLIANLCPLPIHPHGLQPITLEVQQNFAFVSQGEREILPNQGGQNYAYFSAGYGQTLGVSHLYARISEKSSVSVFLCFPFTEQAPFFEYRRFVQEHLPFKLSALHWKAWRLTKKGDTYLGRKVPKTETET